MRRAGARRPRRGARAAPVAGRGRGRGGGGSGHRRRRRAHRRGHGARKRGAGGGAGRPAARRGVGNKHARGGTQAPRRGAARPARRLAGRRDPRARGAPRRGTTGVHARAGRGAGPSRGGDCARRHAARRGGHGRGAQSIRRGAAVRPAPLRPRGQGHGARRGSPRAHRGACRPGRRADVGASPVGVADADVGTPAPCRRGARRGPGHRQRAFGGGRRATVPAARRARPSRRGARRGRDGSAHPGPRARRIPSRWWSTPSSHSRPASPARRSRR